MSALTNHTKRPVGAAAGPPARAMSLQASGLSGRPWADRGRRSSTAAGPLPAARGATPTLSPDTPVAVAINTACVRLGKPFPAEAVRALEANWYGSAAELVALPDDTALSLGVPLRLKAAVADMLGTQAPAQPEPAAPAAPASDRPEGSSRGLLRSAMQLLGSFVGFDSAPQQPAAVRQTSPQQPAAAQQASSQQSAAARQSRPQQPAAAQQARPPQLAATQQAPPLQLAATQQASPQQPAAAAQQASIQRPAEAQLASAQQLTAGSRPADVRSSGQQEPAAKPAAARGSDASSVLAVPALDAATEEDWAALAIEERRTPKLTRFGNAYANLEKVTKRTRLERYALSEAEMSPALRDQLAAFHRFCTVRFFGAQADPISEGTAAKYADHLRGMLGWLHRERGVPLDALSLSLLLPSSEREGVAVVFDYVLWLHQERSISVNTEGLVVRAAASAAKFLYHGESRVLPGRGESAYSDLGVVKELRAMANAAKRQAKVAARVSDEDKKWLTWPEYLQLCSELRRECAGRDSYGRRRADSAVAWSLQRYLIFAILSCVPDRQRTLRELEVGRTLVQDREGRWLIRHGPGDYKTGRSYGQRPPLVIAPHIYPELEAFMGRWRACLEPRHGLLFTQRNGEPFTDKSLFKLFWTTAYRLTGKKMNPHLVRDSVVTFLRGGGATEQELEALALYMGHSVDMQRNTYDRRTKEQKVEPAVELLASLNTRAMAAAGAGGI